MRKHRALIAVVVFSLVALPGTSVAKDPPTTGFRAISGPAAATFTLPADVTELWRAHLATGLTQIRYQQHASGADVLGGQLTVLLRSGSIAAVIGSHYPGLTAANTVRLTRTDARVIAQQRIGSQGRWFVKLMLDPADRHLFYAVESRRFASRWIYWIDASSGAIRNAYNAIAHDGPGIGVKGDTKQLDTNPEGGTNVLRSSDGRQATFDNRNQRDGGLPGVLMTDADDIWNLLGVASPGQPAAVDAHYYANVVDDFYTTTFNRNSIDNAGLTIRSSVHYGRKYNNAFWNGNQMVYGDGDQRNFREFSGSLEVIGHELTHGVTQYTSNLIYQDESGALNESFSDIIGATIERATNEPTSSNCVQVVQNSCSDWALAEDLDLQPQKDDVAGFRNMADPQEDNDPDHYSELVIDPSDNGGVHTNSGISNHAYYLLVTGGQNAGCDNVGSNGHTHTLDCNVSVPGIGLNEAAQIFYAGFTSLPENATFCDARNATVTAAVARQTGFDDETSLAWDAVGVHAGCTGAPPVPVCEFPNVTIPFESRHPYQSDTDCTWIYTNTAANYKLVFGRLETELDFDYVYVYDGNGVQLHQLTGINTGFVTDCITTQTARVRLQSDQLLNKWGFEVVGTQGC